VVYLAVGVALTAAVSLLPVPAGGVLPDLAGRAAKLVLSCGLGCSAGIAILVGVHRYRPTRRLPWYLLAASQVVSASAAAFSLSIFAFFSAPMAHDVVHQERFLVVADVLYLAHDPILVAGLLLLVLARQRLWTPQGDSQGGRPHGGLQRALRGDRASLLDAAVIALGVGLVSWLFLIHPTVGLYVGNAPFAGLAKAASIAFPLMDLVVVGGVVGLLVSPGRRAASSYLLSMSLLLWAGADSASAHMWLIGTSTSTAGSLLVATRLGSAVLLSAAALHPSMRSLTEPGLTEPSDGSEAPSEAPSRTHMSRRRLTLVTVASLLAPAALVAQAMLGQRIDVPVIAGVTAALLLLVAGRLSGLVDEQRQAAITDGLTGLYNRQFFEATLALEASQAARSGQDLGLLVLDIDRFKRINDAYGHAAGDGALREIAARLAARSRSGDVVARYGGEEFVVLLRDTSLAALPETAERLRHEIGDVPVSLAEADGTWLAVTVSIGAAAWPIHAHSAEELARVADQALVAAKRRGRDQVQIGAQTGVQIGQQASDQGVHPGAVGDGADEQGEDAVLAYLERLADQIDARLAAEEHSAAIARWSGVVADHLRLGPDLRRCCELAGRLHDIGKVVVPDEILLKRGPLTDRDWAVLRCHPVQGARLVGLAAGLSRVALVVRQHHERFDGSGYPDRRGGHDIRIEARIVAVCDAWAAMRANRAYCADRPVEEVRQQLLEGSGRQFDPMVVMAFLELEQAGVVGTVSEVRVPSSAR